MVFESCDKSVGGKIDEDDQWEFVFPFNEEIIPSFLGWFPWSLEEFNFILMISLDKRGIISFMALNNVAM